MPTKDDLISQSFRHSRGQRSITYKGANPLERTPEEQKGIVIRLCDKIFSKIKRIINYLCTLTLSDI